MSKMRKENPAFLNKTHTEKVVEGIRERMSGENNPMFGKHTSQ